MGVTFGQNSISPFPAKALASEDLARLEETPVHLGYCSICGRFEILKGNIGDKLYCRKCIEHEFNVII